MPRNYSKFNSARTQADQAQKSVEGMFIAMNTTTTASTHADVDGATEWATANTDINILQLTNGVFGDAASWASVASNSLTLAAGTYRIEFGIDVRSTTASTLIHWAITDSTFATHIGESLYTTPLDLPTDEDNGWIGSTIQFTLADETALKFHIGCETGAATLGRGDFGQIRVFKVK